MKTKIPIEHQKALIELANDPNLFEALVAFGGDLYARGKLKGMLQGGMAVLAGVAIGSVGEEIIKYFKNKKSNT